MRRVCGGRAEGWKDDVFDIICVSSLCIRVGGGGFCCLEKLLRIPGVEILWRLANIVGGGTGWFIIFRGVENLAGG